MHRTPRYTQVEAATSARRAGHGPLKRGVTDVGLISDYRRLDGKRQPVSTARALSRRGDEHAGVLLSERR